MNSKTLIIGNGYIGSAIARHLRDVDTIDWQSNGGDYDSLTKAFLLSYKTIVLTAGHSSVPQCLADPYGAWENNVSKFVRLLEKIQHQTFIYASSGSVYDQCADVTEGNQQFKTTNMLNLTKYAIDQVAQLSNKNYYGLRFGTVAGWSPTPRSDLMINKMFANRFTGKVRIANPQIRRPILAMSDLVKAVKAIIDNPVNPGIYNLASFTKSVKEIGTEVAEYLDLKVEELPPTPAYDFDIDVSKFLSNYRFVFQGTIPTILGSLIDEKID